MKLLKYSLYAVIVSLILLVGYIACTPNSINDIGLKALSCIKKIKGDAVDLQTIANTSSPIMSHDAWSVLLKQHVSEIGQVNYKGFVKDKSQLEAYLNTLSTHSPGSNWSNADKLAYWINAYNAFTVKLIIDNYPLKSIKDIGDGVTMINSPWDIKFFKIGGVDFDLNTIEHEILRKDFVEPRIHFAINCASYSCPNLRNEAFEVNRLEQQLEEQAFAFINNVDKNFITTSSTKVSKLFSWFEGDFEKVAPIKKYLKKYNKALQEENKMEYMDYIWALNEQ